MVMTRLGTGAPTAKNGEPIPSKRRSRVAAVGTRTTPQTSTGTPAAKDAPARKAPRGALAVGNHQTAGTTAATSAFVDATVAKLHELLTLRAAGSNQLLAADPVALAEQMVASIPTRHDYDGLVGPFYDTSGLRRWLGISRQAIAARVTAGSLLACPTLDGQLVYPAWQFRSDGTTVPHLAELIKVLRPAAASAWTVASWLRAPGGANLHGSDAVAWLNNGGDLAPVLAEARDDAGRWAS